MRVIITDKLPGQRKNNLKDKPNNSLQLNLYSFLTSFISIALFYIFNYYNIGNSELVQSIFICLIYFLFFLFFIFETSFFPEKYKEKITFITLTLLLDGILLLTSIAFAIGINIIITGTNDFTSIEYIAIFFFVFASLVKIITRKFFLNPVWLVYFVLGGLFLPLVIGLVGVSSVSFLKIMGLTINSDNFGIYLKGMLAICLGFTIGTGWYYGISNTLYNIKKKYYSK